ncbi:MAG TPA: glycosyltransferase [Phycisphaerales bacterium]|nr:glycosyltransferase [Phycisphaerales bacterium]
MLPPLLISLPTGLTIGGVQVWAARLTSELAARGHTTALLLHPEESAPLDIPLHPALQVFRLPSHPISDIPHPTFAPLRASRGDLSPYLPTYRHAITTLNQQTQQPVICIPQHLGDSAGLFAALTRDIPDQFRIAGWCQLDSPYDLRVLDFYSPVIAHIAAVSDHLEHTLRARIPHARIWNIPNATPIDASNPPRPRLNTARPRLLYLGRLDRDIKRVLALPTLSRTLTQLGLRHTLTIIGNGPARDDLARACAGLDTIILRDAATPGEVPALLDDHDIFILPSRAEGLSLALLEALSRGCVPFITHTESGAAQVINSSNGVLVPTPTTADEHAAGEDLARAIAANLHRLPHLSRAAIASITSSRYTLAAQADAAEAFLRAAASEPPLIWPQDRNPSFTAPSPHGSGCTPPDAEHHLRALLDSLAHRTLLIHGVGNHTTELLHIYQEHAHHIAAFTDDNPAAHNTTLLNRPVIAPLDAHTTGATDVIISSWLHQGAIHARRATYEAQGLAVHRIYDNIASVL